MRCPARSPIPNARRWGIENASLSGEAFTRWKNKALKLGALVGRNSLLIDISPGPHLSDIALPGQCVPFRGRSAGDLSQATQGRRTGQ